jgi:hypothetical protein
MALSHRSEEAIQVRIIKLVAEQKLLRRLPSYGYTDEDLQVVKSMHTQGLNNAQIAYKMQRTAASITSKLFELGLKSNPTKRTQYLAWTTAENEILRPFLQKTIPLLELRKLLPNRSDSAIISRVGALRRQLQIQMKRTPIYWTQEDVALLQSYKEHRIANNGSPTWLEIARRFGRPLSSIHDRLAIMKRQEERPVKCE